MGYETKPQLASDSYFKLMVIARINSLEKAIVNNLSEEYKIDFLKKCDEYYKIEIKRLRDMHLKKG